MTRHLLDLDDLTSDELSAILDLGAGPVGEPILDGRGAALLFQKPSARTRHSTEMAVVQLGGHPIYVLPDEVGIDERETAEDLARTLSCYHGLIAARVFEHRVLERMAEAGSVPVLNLLSDLAHPLQGIADLLTIRSEFGSFEGRTVAWVGDYSNVARSLAIGCALTGMAVRFGCPDGYAPSEADLDHFRSMGAPSVTSTAGPQVAVSGASVVVTDAWYSMGQEDEKELRLPIFEPYRVDEALMANAADDAVFMHCLPAHRGDEVTDEVLDGPRSRVWPEAANRLPAARAAIEWLLTRDGAG